MCGFDTVNETVDETVNESRGLVQTWDVAPIVEVEHPNQQPNRQLGRPFIQEYDDSATRQGRLASILTDLRTFVSPQHEVDVDLSGSATVNSQFWLSRFPFRTTAGWIVLAALITVVVARQSLTVDWQAFVLLWLLVDPLWGSIWRMAGGRRGVLPLRNVDMGQTIWLPYITAGSPAELLFGHGHQGALHLMFRVALPTVLLSLGIAFVVGPIALWWTLALFVVTVLGWISRHAFGVTPAILHSLVTVVLPWFPALAILGVGYEDANWRVLALLALFLFLHNWGEQRVIRPVRQTDIDVVGVALLALAQAGVALLLVSTREPIWLAVLAVLWLPTWLALFRRRVTVSLSFWWLLAMLASAAAIGQTMN